MKDFFSQSSGDFSKVLVLPIDALQREALLFLSQASGGGKIQVAGPFGLKRTSYKWFEPVSYLMDGSWQPP